MNTHLRPATTSHWLLLALLLATGLLPVAAYCGAPNTTPGTNQSTAPASGQSQSIWQGHAAIRQAAEGAARRVVQGPADLVADDLDPRLRLKRCTQPLTATVPANGVGATRVTAEVRCAGKQPWRLYLPVQISATRSVVVAARSLARDTVLAPGDVRLAASVSGSAPTGAVRDPAFAVGRRLKRQVNEGQPLTAGLLAAATVIQRGQDVTVEARSGALQVRMAGVARDDGALGDIIEVESKASGRLIQAVVRSAKSVEVLLR